MTASRHAAALFLVPAAPAALHIEVRRSSPQSVLFVHGERSYVLGVASEHAALELHEVSGAHLVVCVDRGSSSARSSTVKIRIWASRDRGDSWMLDRSIDVSSLGARTRLMRDEPPR